jgi:hypothetical protein
MANNDTKSAMNFQSESGNVDFQAEQGGSSSQQGRIKELAGNVNWNRVGVGVGAAAAVAGAAYAATRYVGSRGSNEGGSSARSKQSESGSQGKKSSGTN